MKVKIIADSTCDLVAEQVKALDIEIIPLYVNFGEESYQDGVDLNSVQLYQKVKEKGILPKTAAVTPGDFEKIFNKYLTLGYEIVFLGIGSKFSATINNALIAKDLLESKDIYIVDSQNITCGLALLTLKAVKFRDAGFSAKDILEKISKIIPNVQGLFSVDSLEYLYKGGRLNAMAGGEVSPKAKPIIKVSNGGMKIIEKNLETIEESLDYIINDTISKKEIIDEDAVLIMHSLTLERYEYLRSKLINKINVLRIEPVNTGCVISSHCGEGTIGVFYIQK